MALYTCTYYIVTTDDSLDNIISHHHEVYTPLCDSLSVTFGWSVVFSGSSINKTDHHNISELLLKMALNTIALTPLTITYHTYHHLPYFKHTRQRYNTDLHPQVGMSIYSNL